MFNQVVWKLNNVEVENSNKNFPYRVIFENELNFNKDAKHSFSFDNKLILYFLLYVLQFLSILSILIHRKFVNVRGEKHFDHAVAVHRCERDDDDGVGIIRHPGGPVPAKAQRLFTPMPFDFWLSRPGRDGCGRQGDPCRAFSGRIIKPFLIYQFIKVPKSQSGVVDAKRPIDNRSDVTNTARDAHFVQ